MSTQPLLSIVIANYNYGRFLDEAIQSVLSQSCQDYELIICDGGSTDNSVEVIKKYAGGLPPNTLRVEDLVSSSSPTVYKSKAKVEVEQRNVKELKLKCEVEEWNRNHSSKVGGGVPSAPINERHAAHHCSILDSRLRLSPITYWCSEPDKGQSDAFNKGFARARGKYLTWLNADDVMLPGVIEKLKKASEKHPECEWFVGGCFWLDPEMRIIRCNVAKPFSEMRYHSGEVGVSAPSSFFSNRLLEVVGGVDVRFKFSMDTDLWMKFSNCGSRYQVAMKYAFGFRFHPNAKTSGHNFKDGKLDFSAYDYESDFTCQQLQKEHAWILDGLQIKPFTKIRRLCSVAWIPVVQGLLDTIRHKGLHYRDIIKEWK